MSALKSIESATSRTRRARCAGMSSIALRWPALVRMTAGLSGPARRRPLSLVVGRSEYLSRIHSHRRSSVIIALASPRIASALDEGLDKIKRFLSEASAQGAEIVCFPEAYLPGLRGQDFEVLPFDQTQQERALQAVAQWARTYAVATILGIEKTHGGGPADCRLCHRRPGRAS